MQPVAEMNRVKKSFAGVAALKDAGIEIVPGEVHALIGQNGAGKSTLIKILTGVYRRDEGIVRFDGKDIQISSPREAQNLGIATIFQELNLVPLRSVTENVVMGNEPKRTGGFVDWKESHRRTKGILSRFGVNIDIRLPLGNFSTAIQQLVAIARAVSLDAKLVIMDEATSSLDASEVRTLFGVVRSLRESGVAVLYITHFMDEIFAVCDRVTILRDGQTVGTRKTAHTSKLELIADMLGRDVSDIETTGMTEFGGSDCEVGEELLCAKSVSTGNQLTRFDVTVHRGEIVGLGGLLGSGRTQAARAIFGIDPITSGTMTFKGMPFHPKAPAEAIRKGIAMLSEDRKLEGIVPDMSVKENVTLALLPVLSRGLQIDREKERELVDEYITSLGIKTTDMDQPIRELSGGNQQKVLLARWLVTKPELLILDEPTRGVDVGAKLEIQTIIRDYVDRGGAVVLISSEFEELVEGADRVIVMHEGSCVSELKKPGITENKLVMAMAGYSHEAEVA